MVTNVLLVLVLVGVASISWKLTQLHNAMVTMIHAAAKDSQLLQKKMLEAQTGRAHIFD